MPNSTPYFWSHSHQLLSAATRSEFYVDRIRGHVTNVDVVLLPEGSPGDLWRLLGTLMATYPRFDGYLLTPGSFEAHSRSHEDLALSAWFKERAKFVPDTEQTSYLSDSLEVATADWVLFVTPRAFLTGEPLSVARTEASQFNARCVNLPRKQLTGTYVSRDHLDVRYCDTGVSARLSQLVASSVSGQHASALCTAVDKSSLLIDRQFLLSLGGFSSTRAGVDLNMDLSLRLFEAGARIVLSRAVEFLTDEEYAEVSLDWREWHTSLHLRDQPKLPRQNLFLRSVGPRVALLTDVTGWAFDNIATQLEQHLSSEFQFDVIPVGEVGGLSRALILAEDADLVHFFWRELPHEILSGRMFEDLLRRGLDPKAFSERFLSNKAFTTTIYDHLFNSHDDVRLRSAAFNWLDAYSVVNQILMKTYSGFGGIMHPPLCTTQDGIDLSLFTPKVRSRAETENLVIGWVGNSEWGDPDLDVKGLRTVLRPTLDLLRSEGICFDELIVDRKSGYVRHEAMPNLYRQMDIIVITSSMEGTPNPLLEGMASGLAVVTTDVGVAREVLPESQRRFIIQERSVSQFAAALGALITQRALVDELADDNVREIRSWDWANQASNYRVLFEGALGRRKQSHGLESVIAEASKLSIKR